MGSQLEATRGRAASRSFRRRLKRALKAPLVALSLALAPRILAAYCWLVWKTSRLENRLDEVLFDGRRRYGRVVCVLWHQEVVTVPWSYRHQRPHALASSRDAGYVITRCLEYFGFNVFRSGAAGRKGGRGEFVVRAMIEHMNESPDVIYGITVDGSKGPRFRMKLGAVKIAAACRAPVYCVGTQFSRRLRLKTWDRTVVPLPFGRIRMDAFGPFWIDPEADSREERVFRDHLEHELLELHWAQRKDFDGQPPTDVPEGFQPRWEEGRLGAPRLEFDLDFENPPPWAPSAARAPEKA